MNILDFIVKIILMSAIGFIVVFFISLWNYKNSEKEDDD